MPDQMKNYLTIQFIDVESFDNDNATRFEWCQYPCDMFDDFSQVADELSKFCERFKSMIPSIFTCSSNRHCEAMAKIGLSATHAHFSDFNRQRDFQKLCKLNEEIFKNRSIDLVVVTVPHRPEK